MTKESYVEPKVKLYNSQKTKNLITLPPDPLSCEQTVCPTSELPTVLLVELYEDNIPTYFSQCQSMGLR